MVNRPINSVLNKRHHHEALGNKYKDLYEFIPKSLEMMPFVFDWILIYRNWSIVLGEMSEVGRHRRHQGLIWIKTKEYLNSGHFGKMVNCVGWDERSRKLSVYFWGYNRKDETSERLSTLFVEELFAPWPAAWKHQHENAGVNWILFHQTSELLWPITTQADNQMNQLITQKPK